VKLVSYTSEGTIQHQGHEKLYNSLNYSNTLALPLLTSPVGRADNGDKTEWPCPQDLAQ